MVNVLEHVIVELIGIVNGDFSLDTIAADDVLLEESLASHGAYVCDRLRLDPLCKILNYYNGKGVVALRWS
jgi:hypothetical protein